MPPRKTLVLDLDGTLYPSTLGMERKIVPALERAASRRLGVTFAEVVPILQRYNLAYGYCVRGLHHEHGIDPADFIDEVYAGIDRSAVQPNPELRNALATITPHTPVHILTNSSRRHAVEVLDRLGIAGMIARIFSVEDSGYHLEPEPEVYHRPLAALGLDAGQVLTANGLEDEPLFWENHLRVHHRPPEHIPSTFDLVFFLRTEIWALL